MLHTLKLTIQIVVPQLVLFIENGSEMRILQIPCCMLLGCMLVVLLRHS